MRFANVGTPDRLLRLLIGAILIATAFFFLETEPTKLPGIAFIAAGIVLILTALIRFCPLYGIFGWRTTPRG